MVLTVLNVIAVAVDVVVIVIRFFVFQAVTNFNHFFYLTLPFETKSTSESCRVVKTAVRQCATCKFNL